MVGRSLMILAKVAIVVIIVIVFKDKLFELLDNLLEVIKRV